MLTMPNFKLYKGEWIDEDQIDPQPSAAHMVVHPQMPELKLVPSQQFPHLLVPEQSIQCKDIEESIEICKQHFSYTRTEISLAQISMDMAIRFGITLAMSATQATGAAPGTTGLTALPTISNPSSKT